MEKTFVFLKPDAVKRKLVGEILARFEKKNITITNLKVMTADEKTIREHYSHVQHIPIFEEMVKFIISGPIVAAVLEGERVIETVRLMIGKTNVFEALPGTIRGDYGLHNFMNLIHASDSVENAEIETKRFFPEIYK